VNPVPILLLVACLAQTCGTTETATEQRIQVLQVLYDIAESDSGLSTSHPNVTWTKPDTVYRIARKAEVSVKRADFICSMLSRLHYVKQNDKGDVERRLKVYSIEPKGAIYYEQLLAEDAQKDSDFWHSVVVPFLAAALASVLTVFLSHHFHKKQGTPRSQ
jgi:hypothetical protein